MSISLLSTKLYIPPAREHAIARPHLIQKLSSGVARPGSFTLVSGPAGFGKTSLLSEFVTRLQQPAAWVSLDEGDNDPIRFWTYLITACQSIQEEVGQAALELLSTPQPVPEDTVPTILINDLTRLDRSLVLVLDDYHEIQNPSIHAGLLFLLDHLPHNLHLMVSTRSDPPWPLARYRARNQLAEVRARDLRFSFEEALEFLNRTMGLNLSAQEVTALEERTEGWAAGLQLAALSMQGRSDIPAFVKAFTGSHLYVAEYLVEEVIQRQPQDVQSFLLQTSILKRMNPELCEAVTDCQDGQAILQYLHHANIFVVSLDNEGNWFRYHHLFADLLHARLRQSLPAEAIPALHRRASVWYERNGFTPEAVTHALAAKDFERVADLVEQAAHTLVFTGQVNVLRDWLEALPEASFHAHPHLTFYLFWIDILQGRADLSERATQEKQDLLKALPPSPENDRLRGELMAVECRAMALSGRTSRGIHLAQQALAYLPLDDPASRARANSALAIAHDLEGRAEEAAPAYQECFSQAMTAGDYRLAAHTTMVKGLVQCHYGRLHHAARTFQTIIDMGDRVDIASGDEAGAALVKNARANRLFFPAGQGHIGLGCIHLEWNDLKAAENHLKQGMELCRRGGLDGIFIGRRLMSRLRQAHGDLEGALEEIQFPKQAFQRVDDFNVATRQIQIRLAQRDVDSAWRLAAPLVEMLRGDPAAVRLPLLFLEILQAIMARVYLAQGEIGKAQGLLDRLQATAERGQRSARLIEVHLLRALAYQKQNRGSLTSDAIQSMEQALELGRPEGYVLLFLEEGPAVIPLLNAVVSHQATPDRIREYALQILDAFGRIGEPAAPRSAGEAAGLVEQLTPREMEVLALLAAGDSNQTIADKLVITLRTVKKHTGNIYGKLNASSRTQAVARARQLGLLSTD
ncbi:MAG: AAA family ATPase [Anaerolineales bacterium]|nr:MAG: AAA family ATPase [Anaerolineales bacterium]